MIIRFCNVYRKLSTTLVAIVSQRRIRRSVIGHSMQGALSPENFESVLIIFIMSVRTMSQFPYQVQESPNVQMTNVRLATTLEHKRRLGMRSFTLKHQYIVRVATGTLLRTTVFDQVADVR